MTSTREVLVRGRKFIDRPERWIRGGFAVDAEGNEVPDLEEEAFGYCAAAAVQRAAYLLGTADGLDNDGIRSLRNAAEKALAEGMVAYAAASGDASWESRLPSYTLVAQFNDWKEHCEVLAGFDRAIAETEMGEGVST